MTTVARLAPEQFQIRRANAECVCADASAEDSPEPDALARWRFAVVLGCYGYSWVGGADDYAGIARHILNCNTDEGDSYERVEQVVDLDTGKLADVDWTVVKVVDVGAGGTGGVGGVRLVSRPDGPVAAALAAGSGRVLAPDGACSIAFDGELSDRLGEVLGGMVGYWFDVTLRDGTVFGAALLAVARDEDDGQQKATFARSVQPDDALDPAAGAVVQTFDLYEDVAILRPI